MKTEDIIWTLITIVFVGGAIFAYAKCYFVKYLTFIYYSHKSGPSGFFTIAALRDCLYSIMREDGADLSRIELSVAHAYGHKYDGVMMVSQPDGSEKRFKMDITADSSGNIQYEIIKQLKK